MVRLFVAKKGDVLIQNVMFILLNVIFISMLILFLWQQAGSAALMEETYSKKIALLVDSSKPGMEFKLGMHDVMEMAEENGYSFSKVVNVDGNVVNVQLREDGGNSYSFFNDVDVNAYPERDEENDYTGNYVFVVNEVSGGENGN